MCVATDGYQFLDQLEELIITTMNIALQEAQPASVTHMDHQITGIQVAAQPEASRAHTAHQVTDPSIITLVDQLEVLLASATPTGHQITDTQVEAQLAVFRALMGHQIMAPSIITLVVRLEALLALVNPTAHPITAILVALPALATPTDHQTMDTQVVDLPAALVALTVLTVHQDMDQETADSTLKSSIPLFRQHQEHLSAATDHRITYHHPQKTAMDHQIMFHRHQLIATDHQVTATRNLQVTAADTATALCTALDPNSRFQPSSPMTLMAHQLQSSTTTPVTLITRPLALLHQLNNTAVLDMLSMAHRKFNLKHRPILMVHLPVEILRLTSITTTSNTIHKATLSSTLEVTLVVTPLTFKPCRASDMTCSFQKLTLEQTSIAPSVWSHQVSASLPATTRSCNLTPSTKVTHQR